MVTGIVTLGDVSKLLELTELNPITTPASVPVAVKVDVACGSLEPGISGIIPPPPALD